MLAKPPHTVTLSGKMPIRADDHVLDDHNSNQESGSIRKPSRLGWRLDLTPAMTSNPLIRPPACWKSLYQTVPPARPFQF
jgi:hypothetical protein